MDIPRSSESYYPNQDDIYPNQSKEFTNNNILYNNNLDSFKKYKDEDDNIDHDRNDLYSNINDSYNNRNDSYNNKNDSYNNRNDDYNNRNSHENINNDEYVKSILDKTSLQSLNRGWNNRNEIFIISIMLSCKNYKLMHDMSARNYNNIHKIMKIVLVIFSSFLSVLTAYPGTCSDNILTIVQYCVTYIVTLFSILMNFFSYSQLSEKHKSAAGEFLKIHHEIQQQMCLFKRDRFVAFRYISRIIKEYDSLIMTSPLIIPYILKKCKNEITDSECNIRDIVQEMITIKMDNLQYNNLLQSNSNTTGTSVSGINTNNSRDLSNDSNMFINNKSRGIDVSGVLMNNQNQLIIDGDINDNEIEKCNSEQIKELRLRFFKENSTYEYLRFLQNEIG